MRPYRGENADPKPSVSKPSGQWRKYYACKVLKGDHEFELIKPRHLDFVKEIRQMTVQQYYAYQKEEMEQASSSSFRRYFGVMYCYKCRACGKEEVETDKRKNKRIKIKI